MYEFWYDYVKPRYGKKKAKLCHMDTDSFKVYIKTEHIQSGIAKYVERTLYASNYELDRPLHKGENKQVMGITKYELRGRREQFLE